jgi:hypothetical protein
MNAICVERTMHEQSMGISSPTCMLVFSVLRLPGGPQYPQVPASGVKGDITARIESIDSLADETRYYTMLWWPVASPDGLYRDASEESSYEDVTPLTLALDATTGATLRKGYP